MRRTLATGALLLAGVLVTGCAAGTPSASEETAPSDPAAVVDVRVGLEPTSLDVTTTSGAALQQLMRGNVYEGLVGRTPDGEILPALATEWTVSPDGLVYTFDIRPGVRFHDGSEMTAADVVASLDAARAEGSLNPDGKRMASVESVDAPDDTTVVITLKTRDIALLDTLTTSAGMILPAGNAVDLAAASNGTGPYTVGQWVRGSTIALEPFAEYWGEAPKNGGVVFHYITDETTAATAMRSGELDLMAGASAETAELFRADAGFDVVAGDSTSWMVLGMNNAVEPLTDQRVRQAIRQGIDKDGLIEVIGGQAIPVGTMTVPSDPWHVDMTGFAPYDPAAARALLAEAGQEDLALTLTVSNTYDTIITEYIAAQLAEIGVDVTIDTVEFATWLENAYTQKNYELTMVLHVDPSTLTYYGNPGYYWNYDNAEAQRLVAEAREAEDESTRADRLREVAELVAEDSASEWLYSPQTVVIGRDGVQGYPTERIANHFLLSDIAIAE